ncbi:MAG: helix-turn-helix transcriptional regulator [Candidatus Aegiribacteria sp.]|nr:helix-turn-helix transcriptional regulator [Candidatus Aegiribacteria sp.]
MANITQVIVKLGELVRFHRNKAGLTQIQLADLAGVGKSTVYDIEKGKSTVQINSLFAVLAIMNIDVKFSGPLSAVFEKWSVAQSSDK